MNSLQKHAIAALAAAVIAAGALADSDSPQPPMLGEPVLVSEGPYQFLEGGQWDAERERLLFSDTFGETLYELKSDGSVHVVRTETNRVNNLERDPQGRLVACLITGHVRRYDLESGEQADAIADYGGHALSFPNDLAILSDGTIYFSDSKVPRIFRIDPDGSLHGAVPEGGGDAGANGLTLSPDQKTLYGAFSRDGAVRAFDIVSPDRLLGPRLVAETAKMPDGICTDSEGNLYVGTALGVQVFTAAGESLGILALPGLDPKERVTNCVFGGPDRKSLFVMVQGKLFKAPATIPGWSANG